MRPSHSRFALSICYIVAWTFLLPSTGYVQPHPIECQLLRQAVGAITGPCLASMDTVARVTLHASGSDARICRGTASPKWRGGQQEPVVLDLCRSATFRTGTQWFDVLWVDSTRSALRFSLSFDRPAAPTETDLSILRVARSYVRDSAAWNPGTDDQPAMRDPLQGFNCPQRGPRTLFCALYDASVAVEGEYWHGRPAINAVRAAIFTVLPADAPRLRHPLTDFNSAPTTGLQDVQLVFERAIDSIEAKLCERHP